MKLEDFLLNKVRDAPLLMGDLTKQIVFDAKMAVVTGTTEWGNKI